MYTPCQVAVIALKKKKQGNAGDRATVLDKEGGMIHLSREMNKVTESAMWISI
jgi:hypothetical protein